MNQIIILNGLDQNTIVRCLVQVVKKGYVRKLFFVDQKRKKIEKLIKHLKLKANYKIYKDHILIESNKVFYSDIKYLRVALKFPVLIKNNKEKLTAEEYDKKYVNADRKEIRKIVKKIGISNY